MFVAETQENYFYYKRLSLKNEKLELLNYKNSFINN
jgi:hypothetical protein